MKNTTHQGTKVIFRIWGQQKDIIAIFPEEPGTNSPYTCMSYMHIGQHGACDPVSIIAHSSHANKEDYEDLFEELTSIGYSLQVIQRYRQSHLETRKQRLADFS